MNQITNLTHGKNYLVNVTHAQANVANLLYDTLETAQMEVSKKGGDVRPIVGFMQVLETIADNAGKKLYYKKPGSVVPKLLSENTPVLNRDTVVTNGRVFGEDIYDGASILSADEIKKRFNALADATKYDPTIGQAVAEAFGIPFQPTQENDGRSMVDALKNRTPPSISGGRGA